MAEDEIAAAYETYDKKTEGPPMHEEEPSEDCLTGVKHFIG